MTGFCCPLFSTTEFMPHGMCYMWNAKVIWLHVVSDALIAIAYYSIPLTLLYFVRKRRDLQFSWILVCFAIFIIACGTTHVMEIWNIWHPTYWLSGLIKAITALSSIITAILLVRLIPKALAMPSPAALQKAHDDLKIAAEARNRFLANMSHELRTPLNGIIGFSEILADGLPGEVNAEQKEYLEDILQSGQHLLRLINDLLDLTKVASGKMELSPERFSIKEVIDEVSSVVYPLLQKKNIQLTTRVDPKLEPVTLDKHKFRQVLYNLLSNAIKFSGFNGQVSITVEPTEIDRFRLAVRDNGIGIKPGDVKRLFQEFEQLDEGAARLYEGTGLGLALTHKIVQIQGGEIHVESEFGKGTVFVITLPLRAS